MSCRINLNERGEVESVNTPEGKISQLFNELAQKFGTDKALELYSVTDDEMFKDGQRIKHNLKSLYRGTNSVEEVPNRLTWYSEDKDFAEGFGDILVNKNVKLGKVFDSTNIKHVQKLIDSGLELYNEYDDTYFKTAKKASNYADTWDFIENTDGAIDVIEGLGFDSIKILEGGSNVNYIVLHEKSTEPSIEDIINYATQQEEVLSVQDEIDLSNAMYSIGLTHYRQVETLMESNLVKDGILVFTEKNLRSSGLYNTYEINYILNSIEAQNNIRRVRQALKTVENKNIPEIDSNFIVTTSKVNILGKQEILNPFLVEKEVAKAIAGKDLDVSIDDIPYDSIKNNYKKNPTFKMELDNMAKNNRNIQVKKIEDGRLVDKTTNNNKELFKKTIDFSKEVTLSPGIYYLFGITPEVWKASPNEIYNLLKDINDKAAKSGIDMQDLEDKVYTKSQGEILSFLGEFTNLLDSPSDENMNSFTDKYSSFFNVVDEPITETVKTEDDTNVHLDTDLSEYELFNRYGLLKELGNVYKQVEPLTSLEEAYNTLLSNKDKIPPTIKTVEELKNYINKITAEYETEDFNMNQSDLENLIIHKIYFGSPIKEYKVTDKEARTKASTFKTDYKYMTEEYPSDFYKEYLAEKRAGSEEFKNFYSNFSIGERGITLKNNDPITLNSIKMYSGEAIEQYNLVSKYLNLPIEELQDSILVEEMQYNREYAISNPSSVKKLKGDFIVISDKTIAVRNEVENIIKTSTGLYEIDYQSGDVMFYNKLPEGNPNYNSYGEHKSKTFSDVDVTKYSEMEIKPEDFIKAKNYYTKKELEKINTENFSC